MYLLHAVGDYATIPEGLAPPTFSTWTGTAANDGASTCYKVCNQACQENHKCLGEEIKSITRSNSKSCRSCIMKWTLIFSRWQCNNHLPMQPKLSRVRIFYWYTWCKFIQIILTFNRRYPGTFCGPRNIACKNANALWTDGIDTNIEGFQGSFPNSNS